MSDADPVDRLLEDAAGALRAETSGPARSAASTRSRILSTHRARTRRTSQVTTWLAMAAAIFLALGGSTAWAYWTGRLDRFFAPEPSERPTIETPVAPPNRTSIRPPAIEAPIEAPVVEAPVVEAPVVEASVEEVAPVAVEVPVAGEDEGGEPVDPAERRAYREAHALHFDAHDPEGALASWDRYLRSYPRGRFALEARYNRALCLVRLERRDEAEAALAPFARGTHGGYRQAEATALLEALGAE